MAPRRASSLALLALFVAISTLAPNNAWAGASVTTGPTTRYGLAATVTPFVTFKGFSRDESTVDGWSGPEAIGDGNVNTCAGVSSTWNDAEVRGDADVYPVFRVDVLFSSSASSDSPTVKWLGDSCSDSGTTTSDGFTIYTCNAESQGSPGDLHIHTSWGSSKSLYVCEVRAYMQCATVGEWFTAEDGCVPCPAGKYCPAATVTTDTVDMDMYDCQVGTWGALGESTAACSGACDNGYHCPAGSTDPQQEDCGGVQYFCSAGVRATVRGGYRSIGGTDDNHRFGEEECAAGTYCAGGVQQPCPAGTYSTTPGREAVCDAQCPAGYFCPAGSDNPTANKCGLQAWCAEGSSEASTISAGYYGIDPAVPDSLDTFTEQRQCEAGRYCSAGLRSVCPAGTYGDQPGATTSACAGACDPGYYCHAGSTSQQQFPCGNATVYCLEGSRGPRWVDAGHYSTGGATAATHSSQVPCPAGSYCEAGERRFCPAGRYGDVSEEVDPQCTGPCAGGHYCPQGSTLAANRPCGDVSVYCPPGSPAPVEVPLGSYSTGSAEDSPQFRTAATLCEQGHYCIDGVKHLCPAGRYGATEGLSNVTCSGLCNPGAWCEAGAISADGTRCPPGHYCEAGSPVACPAGRFRAAEGGVSVDDCELCPAGTYNSTTAAVSESSCAPCPSLEGSLAGAPRCWPGLIAVVADNPDPVIPGVSPVDTITLYFTAATNTPELQDIDAVSALLNFSAVLTSDMSGQFFSVRAGQPFHDQGARSALRVTLSGDTLANPVASRIGLITVSVLPGGGLLDATGTSHAVRSDAMLLEGTWGAASQPTVSRAVAVDNDRQVGVGVGDALLLSFSPITNQLVGVALPVSPVDFVPPFPPGGLAAMWLDSSTLQLVVTPAAADVLANATFQEQARIGALAFAVQPGANIKPPDESTAASNSTGIVNEGTWGEVPSAFVARHHSHVAMEVRLSLPVNHTGFDLVKYSVQYDTEPTFSTPSAAVVVSPEANAPEGTAVIFNLQTNVSYYFRAAVVVPGLSHLARLEMGLEDESLGPWLPFPGRLPGAVDTRTVACLPDVSPCAVQTRLPEVSEVLLRGAAMATLGGERVTVVGRYLGLDSSLVSMRYTNGFRSYPTTQCSLDFSNTLQETLVCFTSEGAGAGFQWEVTVNGGVSPLSVARKSYFAPVVSGFKGNGTSFAPAATSGGQRVTIQGTNFGPKGDATVDGVVYSPSANRSVVFTARDCEIVKDHEEMSCITDEGAGSQLSWTLTISNQSSVSATTTYAPPVVDAVSLVPASTDLSRCGFCNDTVIAPPPASLSEMATSGRQLVSLRGSGFGSAARYFVVAVSYVSYASGREYVVPPDECFLLVDHVELVCATQPGVGEQYRWAVTVLDQASPLSSLQHAMSYNAPTLTQLTVAAAGGNARTNGGDLVTVTGTSFGAVGELVQLLVNTVPVAFTLTQPHSELTFVTDEVTDGTRSFDVQVRVLQRASAVRTFTVAPLQLDEPAPLSIVFLDGAAAVPGSCGSVTPDQGDIVRIDGSNFGVNVDATTVTVSSLGGTPAPCELCHLSHDVAMCFTKQRVGTLRLAVTTATGVDSATAAYNYESLKQAPRPTAITPATGPTTGGFSVTVTGFDFKNTGGVFLERVADRPEDVSAKPGPGAIPCAVASPDDYQQDSVECTLPPGIGGDYGVVVVGSGVVGRASTDVVFAYEPPTLTGVDVPVLPTAGRVVTVTGDNFGVWPANVSVLVGSSACAVLNVTNTELRCQAPPGVQPSVLLSVVVGGQASPTTLELAYGAPVMDVASVSPTHGPSSGGYPLTITGANFGPPGTPLTVEMQQPGGGAPLVCSPHYVPSVMPAAEWTAGGYGFSHTHVTCVVPELVSGPSAGLVLVISTGAQASPADQGATFSYDPPAVSAVATVGESVAVGGFSLLVSGASFSLSPGVVVGDAAAPCPVVSANHTWLVCEAPPGVGPNVTVVVTGASASSVPHDAARFSYAPPVVTSVNPLSLDARSAVPITVTGRNFGVSRGNALRTVHIGDQVECPAEFVSDDTLRCTGWSLPADTASLVVGREAVSVTVEGQASNGADVELLCPRDSFGDDGERCQDCPVGGVCLGGRTVPFPQPGWFPASRDAFLQCTPASACPGGLNATCAPAYTGVPCSECAPRHYRLEESCKPCPNLAWLYLLAFFVALAVLLGGALWLAKRQINLAGLSIGVDFLQMVAMFTSFSFAWPVQLEGMFQTVSASNFNVQLLAPECSVQWSFEERFALIAGLPLALMAVVGTVAAGFYAVEGVKAWRHRVRNAVTGAHMATPRLSTDTRVVDVMGGFLFASMYYLYLQVVRNSLAVFDCTTSDDGQRVMDAEPAISCTSDDPRYRALFPWAVVTFLLYGVGIPATFGYVLWRYRHEIRADQRLRGMGRGFTSATNPHLAIRRRFQKLYNDFAPERHFWRLLLLGRKLALAFTTIMFNSYLLFQASVSIAVMFFAYVLHARFKPFLPRASVNKAFMETQAFRNVLVGMAPPGLTKQQLDDWVDAEVANAKRRLTYTFDYNQLEAACLIAATTVLLCGMIFESAAFTKGSVPYYVLTYTVIVLMVVVVAAFLGLMAYEVYRSVRYSLVVRRSREKELKGSQSRKLSMANPVLEAKVRLAPAGGGSGRRAVTTRRGPLRQLPATHRRRGGGDSAGVVVAKAGSDDSAGVVVAKAGSGAYVARPGAALGLQGTARSMRWSSNPLRMPGAVSGRSSRGVGTGREAKAMPVRGGGGGGGEGSDGSASGSESDEAVAVPMPPPMAPKPPRGPAPPSAHVGVEEQWSRRRSPSMAAPVAALQRLVGTGLELVDSGVARARRSLTVQRAQTISTNAAGVDSTPATVTRSEFKPRPAARE